MHHDLHGNELPPENYIQAVLDNKAALEGIADFLYRKVSYDALRSKGVSFSTLRVLRNTLIDIIKCAENIQDDQDAAEIKKFTQFSKHMEIVKALLDTIASSRDIRNDIRLEAGRLAMTQDNIIFPSAMVPLWPHH